MHHHARNLERWLTPVVCGMSLALGWSAGAAAAQSEPTVDVPPLEARIEVPQPICSPSGPVRVRFTLTNLSDEPVLLPVPGGFEVRDGLGLPPEVVFGTEQPAIVLRHENEHTWTIPPVQLSETPEQDQDHVRPLRLAPRAIVGADVDLSAYQEKLRYSGTYVVGWSPLGGALGTAVAEFRVEAPKHAVMVTDYGKIEFELDYKEAPLNVRNFLELVRTGFYDQKTFHRIIPGFLIQGGCPLGTGAGMRPDGKTVPAEFHDAPVNFGTLAMAIKPGQPDSASCQFFIALARLPGLDGKVTVIGQAVGEDSLRTLHKLAAIPTDGEDRPKDPVKIRSIILQDADAAHSRTLGLQSTTPQKPQNADNADKSPAPADGTPQ